ncbi:class I SAM-dependent methyltransferase [Pseudonocardia alaniniphila]|uniref:Methyltransferase domain-containing protein n=1 Tax=Pseudonocardia alaniniphila TaxID=75291 RepID=A0ABS9TBA0_9PSEU|nr:methyltransferase domain-containing protein [Pseudonocardia alaniniphila]MCH6165668.1 methyltransferase domain-containing protein [Pseudonocardia alaniniphila]
MAGPLHFDALAETYQQARPPYPEALWDRLRELEVLRPGVRVIELGAGTGEATMRLLGAGADVVAVEPGRALAARLRLRCPSARVVIARAEDAAMGEAQFDLAVAATSVHWLDLGVVIPKLRRAIVDDGHLAVWRTAFGDPRTTTPFRDRIDAIVARRVDEPVRPGPGELDTEGWARLLSSSGDFTVVHVDEFRWTIDLSADQVHGLFRTFSNWTASEAQAAAEAARDLGGTVTEHYVTPLILLRRT